LACLDEALKSFDQAPIFTIHSFCRRMLHEYAFESGAPFNPELITEQEDIKREIVDDFWRIHFYWASPLFVNYALEKRFSPDALLRLVAQGIDRPYLKVIPEIELGDTTTQERRFQEAFHRVAEGWKGARGRIREILEGSEALHRGRYPRARIPLWINNMDYLVLTGGDDTGLFEDFRKFTVTEIRAATKKYYDPPDDSFFHVCEELLEMQSELRGAFEKRLLALKVMLFQYVREKLPLKKEEKNVQHFDDLLTRLEKALYGKGGDILASAIRKKFKAAMIDEFQDTDPIQYAIFKRIFHSGEGSLFLIGDPKQAIYGFRGADIFTYMAAAREVEKRYTLQRNWRSEPGLVRAINTIFSNSKRPFVYREIGFQPVEPAEKEEQEVLKIDPDNREPLQIWLLDAGKLAEPGRVINKEDARGLIRKGVVGGISRLVHQARQGRAFIGQRPLEERDIAVLVRKNREAELVQQDLSALNIPSIVYSSANLFESHEARELERVLASIAEPGNEALFKAALSTDMLGLKGESIETLMANDGEWEKRLVTFREYNHLWQEQGFIRMFRTLLLREGVLVRLMAYRDGERRCTNLLHLGETLHRVSTEKKLDMTGLLKWLMEQRTFGTLRVEEYQLRLESDENAVRIITMHRCKGLEYPVVFCPFTWDGSLANRKGELVFHDKNEEMRLTLDLGSEIEEHRFKAEEESLAENLRLLYVALTRARNRCYLVWGRIKEAETSAPAYLFYYKDPGEEADIARKTALIVNSLSDKEFLKALADIQERAGGTIGIGDNPSDDALVLSLPSERERPLESKRFKGEINRQWRVSSFSSLAHGQRHGEELPDHDAVSEIEEETEEMTAEKEVEQDTVTIFSFPKGTRAGIFFHDILEHLDFTADSALARELVSSKLASYGFEIAWLDVVCEMIHKVVSLPLDPRDEGLCLSKIPNQDRLNELGFYFPLQQISVERLRAIFAKGPHKDILQYYPQYLERLEFSPVKGFMKGFMDMVFRWKDRFYLVDWKSNFLGPRIEDYRQDNVSMAMEENFYHFQYHIYTIALDRYLEMRVPGYSYEKNFGGVYYIFLRGVDPGKGPEYGVFRDRPAAQWIRALGEALMARDREQGQRDA
ncbi:MAG: exodeoxyribonuclease V subunit beta, partial [Deltaproteobacteria bacterium]|nr:exodeoxyribonuclease V subunit beta [Deltaproteobacteria bacterium]